jgi:hypothetical protein
MRTSLLIPPAPTIRPADRVFRPVRLESTVDDDGKTGGILVPRLVEVRAASS